MKNTISKLKNTVEGIKIRLDEAEDQISKLEDNVEKTPRMIKKRKRGSERMLTEKEASQLSDTEFKAMVIRKLTELKENYQKLQ